MYAFGVKTMAYNMLNDWKKAMEENRKQATQAQGAVRRWIKPQQGWIKINVDAACKQGENLVRVGCIARDDRGHFIRARNNVLRGSFQAREAEALSLKEALSWAKQWRINKIVFESNAKILVEAVNGSRGFLILIQLLRNVGTYLNTSTKCYSCLFIGLRTM